MKDDNLYSLLQELGGGPSQKTDWREYYHAIRSRFWVVLLCLVLAGIAAAVFSNRQEPRFQARFDLYQRGRERLAFLVFHRMVEGHLGAPKYGAVQRGMGVNGTDDGIERSFDATPRTA